MQDGAIAFDLDSRHHDGIGRPAVTLLPPHVPHDGRAATRDGFRKRVAYLDADVLGTDLVGAACTSCSSRWPSRVTSWRRRAGSRSSPSGCART